MHHRFSSLSSIVVAASLLAGLPALPAAGADPANAETISEKKVWIRFADKGFQSADEESRAVASFIATLPERTRIRRAQRRTRPGLADISDLPPASDYVEAVRATGAEVHVASRWLNAVSATVTASQLEAIVALPFVRSTELVNRSTFQPVEIKPASGQSIQGNFYGDMQAQLEMMNLPALHAAGYTGAGVAIGVLDTGFHLTHDAYTFPGHAIDVLASWDFINDDANVDFEPGDHPDQVVHGTLVLGTIAAYNPNQLVGAAYDASFILCKTEDVTDEYQGEEDFYVAGLEFIELNGGDVATSSLGYINWYSQSDLDGQTAVTTIGVNMATANGVICCTAAGNGGHDSNPNTSALIAPADAFDVITVGAVEFSGEPAGFSSDGPTADGRIKPEVVTAGDGVFTVSIENDTDHVQTSGTSMSTPQIAGAVACLVQAQPGWSVTQMRAAILDSASYFGSTDPDALFIYGYGMIDALATLDQLQLTPPTPGIAGQVNTLTASSATNGEAVYFVYSRQKGQTEVPGCGGVFVDLSQPIVAGSAIANGSGVASMSSFVPGSAQGLTIHIQAVEVATCRLSGVVTATLQ